MKNRNDNIDALIYSLDSLKESNGVVDEILISNVIKDNINDLVCNTSEIFDSVSVIPYFLPEEIDNFRQTPVYSETKVEYKNNMNKWLESYRLLSNGIITDNLKEQTKIWIEQLEELYIEMNKASNTNTINSIKQSIVELGWNPELDFTIDTRCKVRNTMVEKLKNKYNKNVYDLSGFTSIVDDSPITESADDNKRRYPLYVLLTYVGSGLAKVITRYTKGIYSHAAISLDSDLERIYSYNVSDNGFAIESLKRYLSLDPNSNMCVYTILLTKEELLKVKVKLDYFLLNKKKTKYSVLNILGLLVNKPVELANDMICSQFVDYILKTVDIDVTHKNSGLVTPNDLYLAMNPSIFKIFEGKMVDYDKKKVDRLVNSLINRSISVKEGTDLTSVLEPIMITEAKEFPVQFDDDGNLLIKRMKDLDIDHEYFKSHKLLLVYEKTNNIEGMKYELSKLWFLNNILEKKLYSEKNETVRNNYHKSRARILNDFNKYLKIVTTEDNTFSFTDYYNNSPFSDVTIKINNSTLHHGGKLLKNISKLLMY